MVNAVGVSVELLVAKRICLPYSDNTRPSVTGLFGLCETNESTACCTRVDVDMDRCNIASERLLFFRHDFLATNESILDKVAVETGVLSANLFISPVCNGPYSHVTSCSFILVTIVSC